jgi:ribose 5-phosphate isomerase B
MKRTLAIASDHAGYEMKCSILNYLEEKGYIVKDYGTNSTRPVNYPDFGHLLAEGIEAGDCALGFSLCGSGNGINMTSNKHAGIRAALCWNREISMLARQHNDANICSLPARFIDLDTAREIVDAFLETEYEGGRHDIRVKSIPIHK